MESGIHSSLHENCYHQLVCAKFNLEDGGHYAGFYYAVLRPKKFKICGLQLKKLQF